MNTLRFKTCTKGIILTALVLAPIGASGARSQTMVDQELAARRQAILQQDQLTTDDGQIIDQDAVLVPPPPPVVPEPVVAPIARTSEPAPQSVFSTVNWRDRYYARPYASFYYGPPRGYRYWDYGPSYYRPDYGDYGYRSCYYGTPRLGYYDYPYGGTARVGPLRFYWR